VERRAQLLTTQNVEKGNGGFECLPARRIRLCEYSSKRARVYAPSKQADLILMRMQVQGVLACAQTAGQLNLEKMSIIGHMIFCQASKRKFAPAGTTLIELAAKSS
jgi:hypothetical protein